MLNEELLSLLVCPVGRTPVRLEGESLVCTRCGARFAIKDGIPDMLIEDATLPDGCATIDDLVCSKEGPVKSA